MQFVEIDKDHMPEIGETYTFLIGWYEGVPDSAFQERLVTWDFDGNLHDFTHYLYCVQPIRKRR